MRMIGILFALVTSAFVVTSAPAQEPQPFTYRWYKKDAYWSQFYCGGRYRPEGCNRYRRWRRHHRPTVYSNGASDTYCHRLIEATGDQAQSKDSAENLALRTWQGRVRFHFGEKYLSFENARDKKITCSPSSVADTVGGKIQDKLLGISHFRCELSARPCRAPARKLGKEDD